MIEKLHSNISNKLKNFSNLPGIHLWQKDENSLYTWSNKEFFNKFGFQRLEEMIGCSDYELKCQAATLAALFQNFDKKTILNQQTLRFIEVLKLNNDEWGMTLIDKMPIFNEDKKCRGIFGHGIDITNSFFPLCYALEKRSKKATNLSQRSYLIAKKNSQMTSFSMDQLEIIFFLLRSRTLKEISFLLNNSMTEIEKKIEALCLKFNCQTLQEMVTLAEEKGMFNIVPETVLNNCNFLN